MEEKLYIFSESSQSMQDICGVTTVVGDWSLKPIEIQKARCVWIGKRSINDGCRFSIVSESQLFPDYENYGWDYSNCDGYGSASFYTQSWNEYLEEEGLL